MDDFEQYLQQGEPSQKKRTEAWQTAIGLQDVDGLKPSKYLIETAQQHIEGDITISEVQKRIDSYYESKSVRLSIVEGDRTEEADKVAARIAELLEEQTFSFAPSELIRIHRKLFTGIYKFAGKIRDYNITKKEWVLDGKTVFYASADSIQETLDYDFSAERNFSYQNLPIDKSMAHICAFVANVWQIHAFGEGNTRTVAVFFIKYLRNFGFNINNEAFEKHSWFFRNALVRANYNDLQNNIHATTEPLMRFMNFLILNEKADLRNRTLHIRYNKGLETEVQNKPIICDLKVQNEPLNHNLDLQEATVLQSIKENSDITMDEIAQRIHKSRSTVKRIVETLKDKNHIERTGARKNGKWKIKQ